jgi:hypothetical protein
MTNLEKQRRYPTRPYLNFQASETPTTREVVLDVQNPPRIWEPSEVVTRFINAVNGKRIEMGNVREGLSEDLRISLVHSMPNRRVPIAHEPASPAYFVLQFDPVRKKEVLRILWIPVINGEGLKVGHKMIRSDRKNAEIFAEVTKDDKRLSSGRIARIEGAEEYLAMIDRIRHGREDLTSDQPLGRLVNTLYHFGFIPIGNDGKVEYPVFV